MIAISSYQNPVELGLYSTKELAETVLELVKPYQVASIVKTIFSTE